MSVIVNRLRELAEAATNKVVEEDTAKRSHKSTAERDAVKEDIYHFDVLTLEEDIVNRMMRDRLRNHWLIYSITFEFEPNNHVFMCVITKTGMVINLEFTIEDCWYDDYSASFVIKVPVGSIDMDSFIINIVMRLLGSFIFSLCGLIFNPFSIGQKGSTFRLGKDGQVRFDLVPDGEIHDWMPWPKESDEMKGPRLLTNARTEQSILQMDYYAFRDHVDNQIVQDVPIKTKWIRSVDMAAVLLLPIGVWVSFVILHHYLPTETIEFSFSTYFLISLGILCISVIVMNIPRYIYMYFDTRKKWKSIFVHNHLKIQMRRLHRKIFMQQEAINKVKSQEVYGKQEYKAQEDIRDALLQIRDKRYLESRILIAEEDQDRKHKVKFILAYIGCTLMEWILLLH